MLLPTLIRQEVENDTHAANLTGSAGTDTHAVSKAMTEDATDTGVEATGGVNAVSVSEWSAQIAATTPTDVVTANAVTPSQAVNKVVVVAQCYIVKQTGNGDVSIKIKEGANVLATQSATGMVNGDAYLFNAEVVLSNVSVAAHTYKATIESSTNHIRWAFANIAVIPISDSSTLSGSAGTDTHAAELTGASGNCKI